MTREHLAMFLVSFLVFGVRSTLFGGWLQNFQSKIDKYEEKEKGEALTKKGQLGKAIAPQNPGKN